MQRTILAHNITAHLSDKWIGQNHFTTKLPTGYTQSRQALTSPSGQANSQARQYLTKVTQLP